ncbi:major capsid protein [Buttiauxella selenatireducens]|uniref:Major capsid protein n=1 Tax=Buttiauxella selenatireducens TaxID=3073902 RepID=A0ABY9SFV0_9ENTR|nr:major capsid protein [Buttiauxella sp. R73]WMY75833.1 major capsid protein [Buttiauxella sp. R73]
MGLSTNFSFADYTNTFVNLPAQNTLLTTLNVFSDRQTSASPKVSLDVIDEIAQKVASSVNRYSSDWSSTVKSSASNHLIEAPLYAFQDRITAADIQPYRKPGSDLQATIMDAVTSSALAMHDKYMRTKEKMFADALFRNTVDAPYTQQPLISWEDEFGYQQATGTIKTNVASGDPLRSLDDAVTAAKVRMGGLAGHLDGFILLAGSNVYKGVKYHPDIRQNVQMGLLDRDVLFNKEILPAFSTFLIDNVRIIEVTDPLYGVGPDDSYLVPRFSKPLSSNIALPFGYVATATSRDLELAFAEPVDFRIWSLQDRFKNVEIFAESSILPVVYRPDMVTLLTNDPA